MRVLGDHPDLYGYWNGFGFNEDEYNGGGYNIPVAPTMIQSGKVFTLFILTPEMLEVFGSCADYVVRHQADTYVVPGQPDTAYVRRRAAA